MPKRGSLTPLRADLAPEVGQLAEELRALFSVLSVSVSECARRMHLDKSVISRYLSGAQIPDEAFVHRLLAGSTKKRCGNPPTQDEVDRLNALHRAALETGGSAHHQILLLRTDLNTALRELADANEQVSLLTMACDGLQARNQKLQDELAHALLHQAATAAAFQVFRQGAHRLNDRSKSPSDLLDSLFARGHALVRLDVNEAYELATLYRESVEFFNRDSAEKLRFSTPNQASGYRPPALSTTMFVNHPDLCGAFIYQGTDGSLLGHHQEIRALLCALEAYRRVGLRIAASMLDSLADYYAYQFELSVERATVLQVNSYDELTNAVLLQRPRLDQDILTITWASTSGFEGLQGEGLWPVDFAHDEVLVTPGTTLTAMTGGQIPPFEHQERNHIHLGRKSIRLHVRSEEVKPYVYTDYNRDFDFSQVPGSGPEYID